MYSYIIGKITELDETMLVLECNNIGYEIFVSSFSVNNLRHFEGEVKLYTYYQQKEDGVCLYGFLNKEEKDLFLKLISVSGVGPKGAMAILSNISCDDLKVVIARQDYNVLAKVKGVGKKTAERILVELKDKIDILPMELMSKEDISTTARGGEVDDAVEVLISLGLTKQEATKTVESCYEVGDNAETLIAKALKKIR